MKQKRFTFSLPESVHSELTRIAAEQGISSRDLIIKSLKIGMIAYETESDPSKELIIRETESPDLVKETKLILV
ncbi:MAG: hypothetical protein ACWA5R_06395 [bacterium]